MTTLNILHRALPANCHARLFDPADVERVVAQGIAILGAGLGHPTLETLTARLQKCPECVLAIERDAGRCHMLIGYAIVYPLTRLAVVELLAGTLRSGRDLTTDHMAANWPAGFGAYISVVWSTGGPRAAATVVAATYQFIVARLGEAHVFARPATPAGRRLMIRLGMQAVALPLTEVWTTHCNISDE